MVIELSGVQYIWSEIICVISKSNERAARVRFEITSMILDQNCTTQSSIGHFTVVCLVTWPRMQVRLEGPCFDTDLSAFLM